MPAAALASLETYYDLARCQGCGELRHEHVPCSVCAKLEWEPNP